MVSNNGRLRRPAAGPQRPGDTRLGSSYNTRVRLRDPRRVRSDQVTCISGAAMLRVGHWVPHDGSAATRRQTSRAQLYYERPTRRPSVGPQRAGDTLLGSSSATRRHTSWKELQYEGQTARPTAGPQRRGDMHLGRSCATSPTLGAPRWVRSDQATNV